MNKIFARAWKHGVVRNVSRMPRMAALWLTSLLVVLAATTGITSCEDEDSGKVGDAVCLACHDGGFAFDARGWNESIHGLFGVACEECHGPGYLHVRNGGRYGIFITNPSDMGFQEAYATCDRCHAPIIDQFEQSTHFSAQAANCFDCHAIHQNPPYVLPFEDNSMCLSCHASMGFDTVEDIDFHSGPFHDVEPETTGESRCSTCHMVPPSQFNQDTGIHSHTFRPVQPIETLEAAEAGVSPLPPNTCAGIAGCHDPNVAGSGLPRDVNDLDNIEFLQNAYSLVGRFEE